MPTVEGLSKVFFGDPLKNFSRDPLTFFGKIPVISTASGTFRISLNLIRSVGSLALGVGSLAIMIPTKLGAMAGSKNCDAAYQSSKWFGGKCVKQFGKGLQGIGRGAIEVVPFGALAFDATRNKVSQISQEKLRPNIEELERQSVESETLPKLPVPLVANDCTNPHPPLSKPSIGVDWEGIGKLIKEAQMPAIDRKKFVALLFENAVHEIIPGLFLGGDYPDGIKKVYSWESKEVSQDQYDQYIAATTRREYLPNSENEKVYQIPPEDSSDVDSDVGIKSFQVENQKYLQEVLKRIDEQLTQGKKVFVFCQQGIDRSAMVVEAYLMAKFNVTYEQAYHFVKNKRNIVGDMEVYANFLNNEFKFHLPNGETEALA